jgi:hypothetical protein
MNLFNRWQNSYTLIEEDTANRLSNPSEVGGVVEVRPPRQDDLPATLNGLINGLLEIQSKWLGLANASPITAFEIVRPDPNQIRFQFVVPTERLNRKLRTHLHNEINGIEFAETSSGLPVATGDTVGCGHLSLGRSDQYPIKTDHDKPGANDIAAALHPDAMKDTRFHLQLLFQPIAGHPIRRWWYTKRTYQHVGFLRKESQTLWGSRPPTPRERKQSKLIENKAGNTRFFTAIRFAIIGAGNYTPSRIKELSGAYNRYESPESGQYFDANTVRSIFPRRIEGFAESIAERRFGRSHAFRLTTEELAALVTLPSRNQPNINTAKP